MKTSGEQGELSQVADVRCRDQDCSLTLIGRASLDERGALSVVPAPDTHPVETSVDLQDGRIVVYSKTALPAAWRGCLLRIRGTVVVVYGPTKSGGEGRIYEPVRKSRLAVEHWACVHGDNS